MKSPADTTSKKNMIKKGSSKDSTKTDQCEVTPLDQPAGGQCDPRDKMGVQASRCSDTGVSDSHTTKTRCLKNIYVSKNYNLEYKVTRIIQCEI